MCTQTMSRDEQRYRLPAAPRVPGMLRCWLAFFSRRKMDQKLHTVMVPPRFLPSHPWGPRPTTAEAPGRAPTAEAPPSRDVVSGQEIAEHEVSLSGSPTPVATGVGPWARREGLRQRPVPYLSTVAR